MYAIVHTGGKQYRVAEGDSVSVEHLSGDIGAQVTFDDIRLIAADDAILVGKPRLEGARVLGTIVDQRKGDKVTVFKFKRRKMYRRKAGHRQLLTQVKIDEIQFATKRAGKVAAEAAREATPKAAPKRKIAAKKAAKKKVRKTKTAARRAKTGKKAPAKQATKSAAKASKKSKKSR